MQHLFDLWGDSFEMKGIYSVTQSYANSFWEVVVLDTFNNRSKDEDNILDQLWKKQMCSEFY